MQWMTHIVRKTTNKLNRNDNTTYQTREHWKLLNSNENSNQSCTRPSGSCRIGLYFHSRSTISNTHSFGMRYYTITNNQSPAAGDIKIVIWLHLGNIKKGDLVTSKSSFGDIWLT